jgi:hypothetical protein
MNLRLAIVALTLAAIAFTIACGGQIIAALYVLVATRVLPFWQVAAVLGLAVLVLAWPFLTERKSP